LLLLLTPFAFALPLLLLELDEVDEARGPYGLAW
jgi:hypothetical protein